MITVRSVSDSFSDLTDQHVAAADLFFECFGISAVAFDCSFLTVPRLCIFSHFNRTPTCERLTNGLDDIDSTWRYFLLHVLLLPVVS